MPSARRLEPRCSDYPGTRVRYDCVIGMPQTDGRAAIFESSVSLVFACARWRMGENCPVYTNRVGIPH